VRAHVDDAVRNRGGGVDRGPGGCVPPLGAGGSIERVDLEVLRADVDEPVRYGWRAEDGAVVEYARHPEGKPGRESGRQLLNNAGYDEDQGVSLQPRVRASKSSASMVHRHRLGPVAANGTSVCSAWMGIRG
jgi:hypothetical protein